MMNIDSTSTICIPSVRSFLPFGTHIINVNAIYIVKGCIDILYMRYRNK